MIVQRTYLQQAGEEITVAVSCSKPSELPGAGLMVQLSLARVGIFDTPGGNNACRCYLTLLSMCINN